MKSTQPQAHAPAAAPWAAIPWSRSPVLTELPVLAGGLALLYAVVVFAHDWAKPLTPQVEISLSS
ncbi:MAG TPA: hypothetical protein VG759_05060, partial [Candidatus Angelobacter sp.]|nr:hypothetical protein [Candidatus Angelobacter sp.]